MLPPRVRNAMGFAGAEYERELRGILAGEPEALGRMQRRCGAAAARALESLRERPFLVVRAAGSLGCDLVALSGEFAFPIEVKSSSADTLRTSSSPALKAQTEAMRRACARAGVLPVYAFRRKGVEAGARSPEERDPWRLFTLPGGGFEGRARLLYERLGKLEPTREGNFVMRWREGLPLHAFLGYLAALRERRAPPPEAVPP